MDEARQVGSFPRRTLSPPRSVGRRASLHRVVADLNRSTVIENTEVNVFLHLDYNDILEIAGF